MNQFFYLPTALNLHNNPSICRFLYPFISQHSKAPSHADSCSDGNHGHSGSLPTIYEDESLQEDEGNELNYSVWGNENKSYIEFIEIKDKIKDVIEWDLVKEATLVYALYHEDSRNSKVTKKNEIKNGRLKLY